MLKQLIQRLLDSRTTPAEASHNAMPDDASISLTPSVTEPSTWQEVLAATAPTDGYVKIQATSTTSAGFIAIMQAPQENRCAASVTGATGQTPMATIPVAKGSTFKVFGDGVRNFTVKIIPSIGGGYQTLKKLILQGGVLCRLSRLYSSLRRSSCRVRRNGSEVKVFSQNKIPEQRSSLTTLRLRFIRLQVMDGLHSAETDHRSMSALPESWERVALTLKVISELQLRFGRGMPLVSIARQTISDRLRQNSFLAKGQRNTSLVGGASC